MTGKVKAPINQEGEGFNRKVNKSEIPTCNILGVNIAAINMDWLIEYLTDNIYNLRGDYICVSNVHTTIMSYENSEYTCIQNGGIMAIPDGGPLASLGKKRGHSLMSRVTGPDLMKNIFEISMEKGYKHYFYGSTKETLDKLIVELESKYPGIQIKGSYSPPFREMNLKENQIIIEEINKVNPDFIWVGLGAPKQEKWMAKNKGKVNGLMIGVGAGFDYCAGNISRAPLWMQRVNLEWLYRLLQEPRRLFRRYLKTNIKFLWLLAIGK
ncbi:WecB/TagA/CpsF family glycosyltransferase [Priestia aryabhattai]|uniref:WecB/TagA/CpsF family glycosyltransferase n=1 Tax=Priestia aryabhattai TaxID=412384 RepID=UPI00366BD9E3